MSARLDVAVEPVGGGRADKVLGPLPHTAGAACSRYAACGMQYAVCGLFGFR